MLHTGPPTTVRSRMAANQAVRGGPERVADTGIRQVAAWDNKCVKVGAGLLFGEKRRVCTPCEAWPNHHRADAFTPDPRCFAIGNRPGAAMLGANDTG